MGTLTHLSSERSTRALTVGIAAAVGLYLVAAVIAEPMRGFAASDSETVVVQLTVAAGLGLSCDANGGGNGSGETLSLGTITFTGDTGVYSDSRAALCHITTNNLTGYTLGWRVATGSGGSMTGHLINANETIIAAFGTGSARNYTKTWELNPAGSTNDSRWGGRVSSTSSGTLSGNMDFGTDASSEKWSRVITGSTLTIRQSSTFAQHGLGDLIKIGFRAQIGSTKAQQSGTYQTTVTLTAATQ